MKKLVGLQRCCGGNCQSWLASEFIVDLFDFDVASQFLQRIGALHHVNKASVLGIEARTAMHSFDPPRAISGQPRQ